MVPFGTVSPGTCILCECKTVPEVITMKEGCLKGEGVLGQRGGKGNWGPGPKKLF